MLSPVPVPDTMSTQNRTPGDMTEDCNACGRDTPHKVALKLLTESDKPENAKFSREPYRVSTCMNCGHETTLRMNNA